MLARTYKKPKKLAAEQPQHNPVFDARIFASGTKSIQKTSAIHNSCFFGLLSILFKIERTTFLKEWNLYSLDLAMKDNLFHYERPGVEN